MESIALYLSQTVAGILSILSKSRNVCNHLADKQHVGVNGDKHLLMYRIQNHF